MENSLIARDFNSLLRRAKNSLFQCVREFPRNLLEQDAIEEDIRARAATFFHPSGTCRMGSDPTAVVDPQLRVRGIQGLRIADASIMPAALNACTHAPTIMIGEKAAAMIAEDS